MKQLKFTALAAFSAALLSLGIASASAQAPDAANANANANANGGDRRAEFRKLMAERLKTQLKVTDDEWAVIQPLIEKVQTKQRDAMGGRFGGFGGPGGPGGGRGGNNGGGPGGNGGGAPPAAPGGQPGGPGRGGNGGSPESQALRTALDSESAAPDEIKAKLAAYRESRKQNAADLAAAREDLKKVLTLRQEAVLVSMGILE